MANKYATELHKSFRSMQRTVTALIELRDLFPEEDPQSSLVQVLVDRLEGDVLGLQREVFACMARLSKK